MNRLRRIIPALLLCLLTLGFVTAPFSVVAQEAKSLDELMNEVDGELDEPSATNSATNNDEQAGEPAGTNGGGIKSLDALMGEVEDEGDIDLPDVEDGEADSDEMPESDRGPPASVEIQEPELPGFFWFGIFAILFVMIALGQPLYVLIGSLTMYLLFFGGVFKEFRLLTSVIEQTRGLADQPVLLAIPFFVISGALMTEGDIAKRLIRFAQSVFGWLPGGLAIAAVFACVFFAAISGSSPVTVIAIGSIMYPALVKRSYPDKFASGLVTSAGSLGILIPPSIPMIVYAIVDPTALKDPIGYSVSTGGGGDAGVKDLFIAGMGPGLLIGTVLACYALYIGRKFKVDKTPFEAATVFRTFKEGFWALNLPVIILGGIYTGIFTPTQAAAVAVIYAMLVEFFIHKSLTLEDIPRVFTESAVLIGSLLIIMALALGFNLYLDRAKIPEQAVEMILDMNLSIITFLLIVNVLLIIVGFFMDILSAILILVPLLAPIAFGLGIHPLHLATVFIVNLEIGYLTPPIGLNLFVASTLFRKGIGEMVRAVIPFVILMLGCLIVVTYVPTVSLGLVSVSKGGDFIVNFPDQEALRAEEEAKKKAAADKAAAQNAPKAADDTKSDGDVKSLDELMNEMGMDGDSETTDTPQTNGATNGESDEPERVKSLEELMDEVE